jgi:hypothetical protein
MCNEGTRVIFFCNSKVETFLLLLSPLAKSLLLGPKYKTSTLVTQLQEMNNSDTRRKRQFRVFRVFIVVCYSRGVNKTKMRI